MQYVRVFTTKNTKRTKDDNELHSNSAVAVVGEKPSFVSFVPFVVKSVSVRRLFTTLVRPPCGGKNTKRTKDDNSLQSNSVPAVLTPKPSFVSFPSFVVKSVSVRRRAMTLIEILTVMAILVILVGAVVVAVLSASRQGPRKGTTGLLLQLAQGLEQYKATYGMYVPQIESPSLGFPNPPPPFYNPDTTQSWQVQASTFALWQALEYDGQFVTVAGQYKVEYTNPEGPFLAPQTGLWSAYYYQDAWQQPICYICNNPPYNQYTLTSAGEDRIFGTPDDIVQP